ncbi:MAG: hypothetical protein LUE64_07140 [Candidatus Gastranaerophilales bacterium]|nr:hypothetical protein [Candidatus Gastranaerophilales bacterium]
MIKKFFRNILKCSHKNALLHGNEGYCPDCGEYIRKSYYIVRCNCCGIKREAKRRFDEIMPKEKFCTNCGNADYTVEKHEKLSFTDINYALEVKEQAYKYGETEKMEIWIDTPPKINSAPPLIAGHPLVLKKITE